MRGLLKGRRWRWVPAAVAALGLIHIVAVLAMPHVANESAVQRLAASLPINRMHVLAPVGPDAQPIPFLPPDVRYAVCVYDVTNGPVTVAANLADATWSIALYTPLADNYYTLAAKDLRRGGVAITIALPSDRPVDAAATPQGGDSHTRVTSPQRRGLAVIRAPMQGLAFNAMIEAELKRATCSIR